MNEKKPAPRDWKSLNSEYESSGINQKLFCQKNGINIATFQYHRRRLINSNLVTKPSVHKLVEIKPLIPVTNVAQNPSAVAWKLSVTILGVVAFEIRLG